MLTVRFRKPSRMPTTSDELGLFLRGVLRENGRDPSRVSQIAMCSVVPEIVYSLRSCCRKYFGLDPFVLQAGARTGLKIRYQPLASARMRRERHRGHHLYPYRTDRHRLRHRSTFDVIRSVTHYLGASSCPHPIALRRWRGYGASPERRVLPNRARGAIDGPAFIGLYFCTGRSCAADSEIRDRCWR